MAFAQVLYLLAEPAIDALGHIDVVSGGPPSAVSPLLCLNGNCLQRRLNECNCIGIHIYILKNLPLTFDTFLPSITYLWSFSSFYSVSFFPFIFTLFHVSLWNLFSKGYTAVPKQNPPPPLNMKFCPSSDTPKFSFHVPFLALLLPPFAFCFTLLTQFFFVCCLFSF